MKVLIIAGLIITALIDVPRMVKNRHWRELIVYAAMYVPVCVLAVLLTFGVKVPSPVMGIQHLLKDVLHLYYPD